MKLSADLVGCTGNTSLSQALSFEKIPFYRNKGRRSIEQSLGTISEMLLGKESVLANFFIYGGSNDAIKNPEIIEEAKKLSEHLFENYSLEPRIYGLANETLCRQKYPKFAKEEDIIKANYLDGEISLLEAKELVEKCFKTLTSFDSFK